MEKPKFLHLLLVFATFLLFSHYGEAKGEVDVDMLNKLKDSGTLDTIKEELEKMLDIKEAKEDIPIAEAYEHLKSVVAQKELKLPESLMKALVHMPSTSNTQANHFAVLTEIADSLNILLTVGSNSNEKLIIEISEKLIEMASKIKSIEEFLAIIRSQQEAVEKKFNKGKTPSEDDKEKLNCEGSKNVNIST